MASAHESFIVYQDLNDRSNVIVVRADDMVVGTFQMMAGPFDDEREAERVAEELRRTGASSPQG